MKVRVALGYKGIAHEFRSIDPADRDGVVRLSGQHLTPVLVHGETVLFDKLPKTHEWEAKAAEATDATALHGIYEASMETLCGGVLDRVEPRRGRLFVFPHDAPHAAMPMLVPPKLILRAEAY